MLGNRIRTAEVIISGHVLATYPAEDTEGLPGIIDGVQWWIADVWIGSVERGWPPEDERIWFPVGGEPEWAVVPKAYPGQTGVWLLRPVSDVSESDAETTILRIPAIPRLRESNTPSLRLEGG